MSDEQTNRQLMSLSSKKQSLFDKRTKLRDQISKLRDSANEIEEQIQKIERDMDRLKFKQSKEKDISHNDNQQDKLDTSDSLDVDEDAPVGDGAISTGALDASSVSHGGDYGGWRFYDKVGSTSQREKKKKSKKAKQTNVDNYVSHYFDNEF